MGWTAFQILTLPILPSLLGAVCIAFARQGAIGRPEDAPAISLPQA
jgi:hypothetical protein